MAVGKTDAAVGQAVDVGGTDGRAAVGADIAEAEVVGNDEQDIGALLRDGGKRGQGREKGEEVVLHI